MSHRTFEKDRPGKLFVGGLNEDIDEKTLEREFSKFGRITESMVIRDKMRNISRGFGFVTYENPMDAEEAVKHMDGKEIHGKKLHVEDAVRGGILNRDDPGRFSGGFRDDGYRGRPRGGGMRGGRGAPPRGGRGGFPPRDGPPRGGGYGGRGGGDGFSRGRGRGGSMMSRFDSMFDSSRSSPPPMRRDDSPPRSGPMSRPLSARGRNGFDSGRGRPISSFDSRHDDRYDSGFSERGMTARSRDPYGSPPRETSRGGGLLDSRLGPSRGSRDYPASSRDYPPSRDYPSQRDYSPERGADRYSYRDSYGQSRGDDRGDTYSRGGAGRGDYLSSRSDLRDSPRDSYAARGGDAGYTSLSSRDYREPLSSRGNDRFDRDYDNGSSSMRFSRDLDSRGPPRSDSYMTRESGAPSRSYGGGGGGSSSLGGSRGPPAFSSRAPYPSGGSDRRSSGDRDSFSAGARRPAGPPPSRGGPPPSKRPRSDGPSSRPPPPSFRR